MITEETVLDPMEATLEFFSTPVELRDRPYLRTGDLYEFGYGRPFASQFLRSYLENSKVYERRRLTGLTKNKHVGMYISV